MEEKEILLRQAQERKKEYGQIMAHVEALETEIKERKQDLKNAKAHAEAALTGHIGLMNEIEQKFPAGK